MNNQGPGARGPRDSGRALRQGQHTTNDREILFPLGLRANLENTGRRVAAPTGIGFCWAPQLPRAVFRKAAGWGGETAALRFLNARSAEEAGRKARRARAVTAGHEPRSTATWWRRSLSRPPAPRPRSGIVQHWRPQLPGAQLVVVNTGPPANNPLPLSHRSPSPQSLTLTRIPISPAGRRPPQTWSKASRRGSLFVSVATPLISSQPFVVSPTIATDQ